MSNVADINEHSDSSSASPHSISRKYGGSTIIMAKGANQTSASAGAHCTRIISPLHQSFLSLSPTLPSQTGKIVNEFPTRPEPSYTSRGRALSRSFSVPNMAHHLTGRSRDNNDMVSPIARPEPQAGSGTRHSNSSVKHLTCFWWKEKGGCRFSADDCLYAHYDTGHHTDPPRQLIPGEPALAGRKLDRAMRSLATIAAHRSNASLSSMAGSRQPSRPATPAVGADMVTGSNVSFSSPLTSPLTMQVHSHNHSEPNLTRFISDYQLLHTLTEQNTREKEILITNIETLRAENNGMKGELDGLRLAQEQLLAEREGLHRRIADLEMDRTQGFAGRNVSNPYGAIGRGRINTEARYIGGLLADE